MTLTRSKDRKVANSLTPSQGVRIANSFGLPSGRQYSCPNATAYCEKICYAGKLEKVYKGVSKVLISNWEQLKDASISEMLLLLDEMLCAFERECEKHNAEKLFRIHWDGDFFSGDYVIAWSIAIQKHPEIIFWVYTRVPSAAAFLHDERLHNLSLYFSADPDNIDIAREMQKRGIRIAYVDENFAAGKNEFPKATRCPENNKAIPLVSEKGSACKRCGLCIFERNDVLFSRTKR